MKSTRFFLVFLLFAFLGFLSANDACNDCHGDAGDPDMYVKISEGAVHEGMDCADCHGISGEHDVPLPKVNCSDCHPGPVASLKNSTHGEKLESWLGEKNSVSNQCLACHGEHVHSVKPTSDEQSPVHPKNRIDTCMKCHEKIERGTLHSFADSVHGKAAKAGNENAPDCASCHGNHSIQSTGQPASPTSPWQVASTCGKCHKESMTEYKEGTHWKTFKRGFKLAPVCTDCHGSHNVLSSDNPDSPSHPHRISDNCASCHESQQVARRFDLDESRVQSFESSFHGLSEKFGDTRVANCASCHSSHKVLPNTNPESSTHPSNLAKTCGECHPGITEENLSIDIHSDTRRGHFWLTDWVVLFYKVIIVLTIGGMLTHNLIDLFGKSVRGLPFHRRKALRPRFSVFERLQHAIMATCFILLAWSGFALAFPGSWISEPFFFFDDPSYVRRWTHRIAAFVFLGISVIHVLYLFGAKRGRKNLYEMLPRFQDLKDAIATMSFCLGIRKKPLGHASHFTYIEKAEYWALVWGSLVMTATGFILMYVNISLAEMPYWGIQLAAAIHYWEAILAVLAILIWHGYWVVFDPEVYPMNLTWLIGDPRPEGEVGTASPEAHDIGVKELEEVEKAEEQTEEKEKSPGDNSTNFGN